MNADTPRWIYRFDNYGRAFLLLREALDILKARPLSPLEREGIIQRFEYTWELAWKTLKDYLEHSGVVLDTVTPASVIKAAFAANVITDGEGWMRALDARNQMSHTYSPKAFERIIADIAAQHFALLDMLYSTLQKKIA